MYSESIVERSQHRVEKELGLKLHRYDFDDSINISASLERLIDSRTGAPIRPPTPTEQQFIKNELTLSAIDFRYWLRYCNTPDSPIWMGDATFCPIGDVRVGDYVMGWCRKYGPNSTKFTRAYLKQSKVLAKKSRMADTVRVRFRSGKVIVCTPDHLWLSVSAGGKKEYWVTAKIGKRIKRFISPERSVCPEQYRWEAAWLGGIYDGEGCRYTIAQYEAHNPIVHDAICKNLDLLKLPYTANELGVRLVGGREAFVQFLNQCRPHRSDSLFRMIIRHGQAWSWAEEVVEVTPNGTKEVVSLQTDTGNYVAWGLGSHNCTIEIDGGGSGPLRLKESQDIALKRYIGPAEEAMHEQREEQLALGVPEAQIVVDGIRFYWHKARQLYATTTARALLFHRLLFNRDIRGMTAPADDDQIIRLYDRDKRLLNGLPWWMRPSVTDDDYDVKGEHIYFGKLRSSISYFSSTKKSGMGQGSQFQLQHLTECAFWPNPEYQIDYILKDTLPQSFNTLAVRESTANGLDDWWHQSTEDARHHRSGWGYIFMPWYVVSSKRRRRPPSSEWRPDPITLKHADMVLNTSPEWVGRPITLDREQLYWWESERRDAQKKQGLYAFYSNTPATPEESFQNVDSVAFSLEQIEKWQLGVSIPPGLEVIQRG